VRLSRAVGLPAAAGWRRPVVLLPTDFPSWREEQRRQALVHELVHVRRRDWATVVVEEAFASVVWFHPGIRWALRELRLARERAVDEETAVLTEGRRAYAGTLVALAGRPLGHVPAPALFATRLERRVESLLKEEAMSRAKTAARLAAGTLVLVAAAAVAARSFPLTTKIEGEASEAKKPERAIVTKVQPAYPADAKEAGIDGNVVLSILVTATGDVTDVKVESGPEKLREASVEAVRQWKYRPAPADTRMHVTIRYQLAKRDEK
jgi:TonB family protein